MESELIKEFKSSPEILLKISSYGISKTFREGEIILNENAYIKSLPVVVTGSVKVMRMDEDGREILLYYIRSGESCIMSFLGGMYNDTSKVKFVADETTVALFIPITRVAELVKEYPEWLDYIFRLYHNRFEELLEVVNAVAYVTHEQLANELGTARVVVSRLLKQLENEQVVSLGRNKITLL